MQKKLFLILVLCSAFLNSMDKKRVLDRNDYFYQQQKEKSQRFAWLNELMQKALQAPAFGEAVIATSTQEQERANQPRRSKRLAAKRIYSKEEEY